MKGKILLFFFALLFALPTFAQRIANYPLVYPYTVSPGRIVPLNNYDAYRNYFVYEVSGLDTVTWFVDIKGQAAKLDGGGGVVPGIINTFGAVKGDGSFLSPIEFNDGVTPGQVWQWNGTAWVLATVSSSSSAFLRNQNNAVPFGINDTIYRKGPINIGGRASWPGAKVFALDSINRNSAVVSGNRVANVVLYDNFNGKWSTYQQAGSTTTIFVDSTGAWRVANATTGTPENPSGSTVYFQVNSLDSTAQLLKYSSGAKVSDTTGSNQNFAYYGTTGKLLYGALNRVPISPGQLKQEGATLNQALAWDGSFWVPTTIGGGGTAIPTDQVAYGNGTAITSDSIVKIRTQNVGGFTNKVLSLRKNLNTVPGGAGILGSIYLDNKYGYFRGGVSPTRTSNTPIYISNPTDDSGSTPFFFRQTVTNNNTQFPPGVTGTTDSTYNNVMHFGFNADGVDPTKTALYASMEPYWGSYGELWQEFHLTNKGGSGLRQGSGIGTSQRRFLTWVFKNLNSSAYSADLSMGADNMAIYQYNTGSEAYLNNRGKYINFSKGSGSKIAAIDIFSAATNGMKISSDSSQNVYKIALNSSQGVSTSAFQMAGFSQYYFKDNAGLNFLSYFNSTKEYLFGGTTYNCIYQFRNQNANSTNNAVMFLADLTNANYNLRGQQFIGNTAGTAGFWTGYRSDADFSYVGGHGAGSTVARSESFVKFAFSRLGSIAYPKGTGFFNIYTEQAGTVAALRLTTNADSIGFFVTGADPNGVITARQGSKAYSSAGKTYTKVTGNNTNTGWNEDGNTSMSWFQNGNAVGAANKFIGTTDNQSLTVRTNSVFVAKYDSTGRIGNGVPFPTAWTHLKAGAVGANSAPLKFSTGAKFQTVNETGAVNFDGGDLYLSDGTNNYNLVKSFIVSPLLDFPSTGPGGTSDLTVSLTGVALNDPISIGVPATVMPAAGGFTAWASNANQITVRYNNNSLVNTYDPASGTFKLTVIKQ